MKEFLEEYGTVCFSILLFIGLISIFVKIFTACQSGAWETGDFF